MRKNISDIFIIYCVMLITLASFNTIAKVELPTFNTQSELVSFVEQLRKQHTENPVEATQTGKSLAKISQDNEWLTAYLYSATYLVEAEIKQENVSGAEHTYNEIFTLFEDVDDPVISARLKMAFLRIRFSKGELEGNEAIYQSLHQRAEQSKSNAEIGEIHLAIGLSQQYSTLLAESIQSYKLAFEFFEKDDDPVNKALVLNALADANNNIGDTKLAIKYFQLALDLHQNFDDKFSESIVLYNLGRAYLFSEDLKNAERAFNDALNISIEIDDTIGIAWAQSILAKVALANQKWLLALDLAQKAQTTFADVGDKHSEFSAVLYQALAHLGLSDIESAESALSKSKAMLPPDNDITTFYEYHDANEQIALTQGEFERAHTSLNKKYEWKMERHQSNKEKDIIRNKVGFDMLIKDTQNELLQKDLELKELKINEQQKEQRIWLLGVVAGALLFMLVVTLLFIQIKNRNRFKALAMRDHLTNSPNRRAILQQAQSKFIEAKFSDMPLIIAIVDLDYFKKLNDNFGHDTGDEVLKNFAMACASALRQQDRFGRYGGEEWLLVFTDTELSQIDMIFERLHRHINKLPAKGLPVEHQVNFSMGAALYDKTKHKNIDALIKDADEKLYFAKEQGRNSIKY